jgi:hypothetical protein
MKTAMVVAAVLAMSLDDLSVIQVVANDRIAQLQTNGQELANNKADAEQVAMAFAPEIKQLMPKRFGPKPNLDRDASVLAFIQKNPGCNGPAVIKAGLADKTQFVSATKRLRDQGKLRLEGKTINARWYAV